MFINEIYITDIFFSAHSVQYHIELKEPITGTSYQEIEEKAKREVEIYMLNNSISGPYILLLL